MAIGEMLWYLVLVAPSRCVGVGPGARTKHTRVAPSLPVARPEAQSHVIIKILMHRSFHWNPKKNSAFSPWFCSQTTGLLCVSVSVRVTENAALTVGFWFHQQPTFEAAQSTNVQRSPFQLKNPRHTREIHPSCSKRGLVYEKGKDEHKTIQDEMRQCKRAHLFSFFFFFGMSRFERRRQTTIYVVHLEVSAFGAEKRKEKEKGVGTALHSH